MKTRPVETHWIQSMSPLYWKPNKSPHLWSKTYPLSSTGNQTKHCSLDLLEPHKVDRHLVYAHPGNQTSSLKSPNLVPLFPPPTPNEDWGKFHHLQCRTYPVCFIGTQVICWEPNKSTTIRSNIGPDFTYENAK